MMVSKQAKIEIVRSKRKTLSLQVESDGTVLVKAPTKLVQKDIDEFIQTHQKWIVKRIEEQNLANAKLANVPYFKEDRHKYKQAARAYFESKVKEITVYLGLSYKKVRLTSATKRWGSCSSKKIINLNWKLIFAPKEVIDYVILHEVVHLKHMNHSKSFWLEVEKHCPNFKEHKKWLSKHSYLLMLK